METPEFEELSPVKYCSDCKEVLPLEQFSKFRRGSQGRQPICKACAHKRVKEYRKTDKGYLAQHVSNTIYKEAQKVPLYQTIKAALDEEAEANLRMFFGDRGVTSKKGDPK